MLSALGTIAYLIFGIIYNIWFAIFSHGESPCGILENKLLDMHNSPEGDRAAGPAFFATILTIAALLWLLLFFFDD